MNERIPGRPGRLVRKMREKGVAGVWRAGSSRGPGRQPGERTSFVWGPDGFVVAVAQADGRTAMRLLNEAGARRPVLVQMVNGPGATRREIVRMELSDFLDLLESHMNRLAQEGRLGDDD